MAIVCHNTKTTSKDESYRLNHAGHQALGTRKHNKAPMSHVIYAMNKKIRLSPEVAVYIVLWLLLYLMPVALFYLRASVDPLIGFRWGDVHEWVANTLHPREGFQPGPWSRYASPFLGRARVLRGASFATRRRMKHPRFRGFALPAWDAGFVGFSSCSI